MTLNEYQTTVSKAAIYRDTVAEQLGENRVYVFPTLGLTGEAGEVAEKVKKVIRDKGGVIDDESRQAIVKELGDVLWYVANLAQDLGVSLDDVAARNIEKVMSRREKGTLHGSGDDR